MGHDDERGSRLLGREIDARYRVDRVVATGSMGTVYEARHVALKKRVALKVLHPNVDNHPELFLRFEREALAGAQMAHPNVTSATDFGTLDDGTRYLVMDFVRGETLREIIDRDAPLGEARVVDIARQIALGLGHIHEREIVHRDLKPRNVIVADGGVVKIVDFGLSKIERERLSASAPEGGDDADEDRLTTRGEIFGTVEYLAPEAAFGMELVDARADLYALGVITYEMLSGKHPFDAKSEAELFAKQRHTPPPAFAERAPDVTIAADLEAIVRKLLDKDFDGRYQSAAEFVAALDEIRPAAPRAPTPLASTAPPPSSEAPPSEVPASEAPSREPSDVRAPSLAPSIHPGAATPRQTLLWAGLGAAALGGLFLALRDPPTATPSPIPIATSAATPTPIPIATSTATATVDLVPSTRPQASSAEDAGQPQLDDAERRTKLALLVEAIEKSAWDDVASQVFALFRADPDVLSHDGAPKIITRAILALTKEAHPKADPVSLRVGTAAGGPDLLLRLIEQQGKSMGAERARVLLRFEDVRQGAPPATLVTFDLRDKPCNEKLALLDRAASVGDARTILALDIVVRGCVKSPKAVDETIARIRARLDAKPRER